MKKAVVLYAFNETPKSCKSLNFFIENSGLNCKDTDYIFLVNQKTKYIMKKIKFSRPKESTLSANNYNIIECPDANSAWFKWNSVIETINGKYEYYAFLKDSTIGPFFPREGKYKKKQKLQHSGKIQNDDKDWITILIKLFNKTDIIVVGTTYNPLVSFPPDNNCRPHLQFNMWIINNVGLEIFKQKGIFSKDYIKYNKTYKTIAGHNKKKKEYLIQKILNNSVNLNSNCYYEPLRDFNIKNITEKFPETYTKRTGRILPIGREEHILNLDPRELLFCKTTNTNIIETDKSYKSLLK